jgi:hypothetical protein
LPVEQYSNGKCIKCKKIIDDIRENEVVDEAIRLKEAIRDQENRLREKNKILA